MTDVIDDLDLDGPPIPPDADGDTASAETTFVCDHIDDGEVCGASFSDANRLRMHKSGKHRDRSQDRKGGSKSKRPTAKDKAPSRAPKQAAARATGGTSGRSTTYASSISMAALGAYLVVPAFDQYDLGIVNSGAPNLASALADLGEQNKTVQRTCDLILGGGSGGAYLQLVLAVSAMFVPIAAHHGLLPDSAGARFGELIGANPAPAPAPMSAPTHEGVGDFAEHPETLVGNLDPTNPDHVLAFMTQVPETVMVDLAGRMMSGGGEQTVVDVPLYSQPPDGVRPTGDDSGDRNPGDRPDELAVVEPLPS